MKQIAHVRVRVGVTLLEQRSLLRAGVHGPAHRQTSLHRNVRKHGVIPARESPPHSPGRQRAPGFGLLRECAAGVCLRNLSGLPTGAARGHPDVAGGCVPVKSDAVRQHVPNHHLNAGIR